MDAILSFINDIANVINQIFSFCISLFEDIAYVIRLTGEFVQKIPSYFSWLPPEVLAIIISAFAIIVIYKILGREG